MKMHLKLEISLFHSAIPKKPATWDLDASLDVMLELLLKSMKVCVIMWAAKGFERTFYLSARKRFSVQCLCRNVIIFFLTTNLF